MKEKLKISVVTVSYNAVDTIEETIKSVVDQTYDNIEYIIIDGGSTDGTVDIIKMYAEGGSETLNHRHRITYWVSEPDRGIYDAMNKGIAAATGDYINFMNSGDIFSDKEILKLIVPHFNEEIIIAGAYNLCFTSGEKKVIHQGNLNKLKIRQPICHQATFINIVYQKQHLYDTTFRCAADYNFLYQAWRRGCTFKYLNEIIADFMFDEGTSFSNFTTSILERRRAWCGEKNTFLRTIYLYLEVVKTMVYKASHNYRK